MLSSDQSTCNKLQEANELLEAENQRLQEQVESLKADNDDLRASLMQRDDELWDETTKSDGLEETIQQLESQIEQLEDKIDELQQPGL